ncbi:GTP 3',8-cyclase MoaA [Cerasicoccus arenae]|uniref:GTP 3',8-cyclase n=1 Tax=Cerasicoccus arenae TaxID=424488 RepID=A0A8J3GEP3_9BACT|nr:GTP 3',8-cyclase MoaA [Cerasicoccus arenae]MBK1857251.1 GTP 3',8-cyclase MoaA [Cerasicoccus arenae]GHC00282.1 cyclic pyranopterin monophosphate synthase [Cerasicoccus arenae]
MISDSTFALQDKETLPDKVSKATDVADRRGRFLRDLRLSIIDRCNLRCQYCLPKELFGEDFHFRRIDELLSYEQLARIVDGFVSFGVEKVRLTGGEPLLRPGLDGFIAQLRAAHPTIDLALTTNGLRLEAMASALHEAGLDRVNISLDALDAAVAERMAGRAFSPQRVLLAAEAAREAGLGVKLNAVIKRGVNESEILPLARASFERGFSLRYIEYMDVGTTNGWRREDVMSGAEIREQLRELGELEPLPAKVFGEVARRYRYVGTDVEVGFIESVSAPFCGSCTRARVSAEGELFTCLFASKGVDLKPLLASEEDIGPMLRNLWLHRDDQYSETRTAHPHGAGSSNAPEEMWRLGG